MTLDAQGLKSAGLLPDDHVAAFWSGSLAEGWAHASSDVDWYVVTASRPELESAATQLYTVEPMDVPIVVRFDGDTRWDVEYWLETQIDQIIEKLNVQDFPSRIPMFLYPEVDLLYRVAIGVAVSGEEWLAKTKARLDRYSLKHVLAARALNEADSCLDDALGLLESDDLAASVLSCRDAFGWVIDAISATKGELSPSSKWRARRFQRAKPAEITWDEYWQWETMAELDRSNPKPWVLAIVQRCQELMIDIDLSPGDGGKAE